MKNYTIENGKISLLKYSIKYSFNKSLNFKDEKISGTMYIKDEFELDNEKERLDKYNAEYTIEELDISNIKQFDGIEVGSEEEAEDLINPNIEKVIKEKLEEISNMCEITIHNGIDVIISTGEKKHFSLTTNDQINLASLVNQISLNNVDVSNGVPYHADGEICTFYSLEDFTLIANTATNYVVAQRTYCNHLMMYLKSLSSINDIKSVTYGQELTGEYLESYNKILGIN